MQTLITKNKHPLTVEESEKVRARVNRTRWITSISIASAALVIAIIALFIK